MWSLAGEDFGYSVAVLRGPCGAGRGHVGERYIELSALRGAEWGTTLQQRPVLAREARAELLLVTARLDHGVRTMGDDVEFPVGDLSMGQMLADCADEARRHGETDRHNLGRLAVMGSQIGFERVDGGGVRALGYEYHWLPGWILVRIGEECHILVTLGSGGLIERYPPQFAEVGRTERLVHVQLAQRLDPKHGQPGDARCPGEGRLARQQQYECFELQREPAQLATPDRGHLRDLNLGRLHPGTPHLELALVLEEVQVPTDIDVVDWIHTGLPRRGNGAAYLEIDTDVEFSLIQIEVHSGYEPQGASVALMGRRLTTRASAPVGCCAAG